MNQASMTGAQAGPGSPGEAGALGWRGLTWFAGLGACLLAGLMMFFGACYPVHQDLAGSALSGRLAVILGSAYGNYSIYFPPAERLWFSLAARLGDLTGLRLDLAVVAMTGVMVLAGAGLAYRIRRVAVGASPLFLAGSVAVLVILPILFKNVFGLREHFVALGLWPYLVLRVSDPDGTRVGWRLRAAVGLWLGAMVLFKYLYSAVVLLVEIADAAVQRRAALLLRTENVIAGGIVFLYLFLWLGIDPAQREAVGAMRSAIDAALADPAENWMQAARNAGPALFLLLVCLFYKVPGPVTAIGLALVAGGIAAAWAQGRWYSHHLFPITLAYVAWWWMAGRRFRWPGHVALAVLIAIPVFAQFRSSAQYHEQVAELDQALGAAGLSVAGKRVGLLNLHPSPYNQYLAAHRAARWNPLMNNAYVSAELQPFDRPENAGKPLPPAKLDDPGRKMLHDQMLRLWEDKPPDVLILDHSFRWPLHYIDVDWKQAFSRDPRFGALLARYRPVLNHRGRRLKFTYYVRNP